MVHLAGLEPANLTVLDPQSSVYAIPPQVHNENYLKAKKFHKIAKNHLLPSK